MLQSIVGNVDINSAAVLVVGFLMLGVVVTTWVANRRSRTEINNDFELAKIKQADETNLAAARIANDRDVKIKQLDQNLITSHRSDD